MGASSPSSNLGGLRDRSIFFSVFRWLKIASNLVVLISVTIGLTGYLTKNMASRHRLRASPASSVNRTRSGNDDRHRHHYHHQHHHLRVFLRVRGKEQKKAHHEVIKRIRLYVCTCVRVYVCTCARVYVCTCVRVYVCTCVR